MPCKKKKNLTQKVVIPKGMINPDETTVIEIPADLQRQPVVVAKRKVGEIPSRSSEFSRPRSGSAGRSQNVYRANDPNFVPQYASTPRRRQEPYQSNSFYMMEMEEGFEGPVNLDKTEREERAQLQKDLEDFQRARRKLYARASYFADEHKQRNHSNAGCGSRRRLF